MGQYTRTVDVYPWLLDTNSNFQSQVWADEHVVSETDFAIPLTPTQFAVNQFHIEIYIYSYVGTISLDDVSMQ